MSVASELVTLIEGKVQTLLPAYKVMPFVYALELNDRLADKNYGVKLGSASTISGTNHAATFDHNVEIDLTARYEPKKTSGDMDLRNKINLLSDDIETLYKEFYRRPGSLASASLLVIAPVDLSEPKIDNDNNLVTVTLTLSVKYRVSNI
jgi:hypothetical protein